MKDEMEQKKKEVISYRTIHLDELKKISKIRNVSLSTFTGEIIHDYLHHRNIIKKYDMLNDGRQFISAAFETLDPSVFDQIATIGANECIRGAKMSMNHFSLENLLTYFREWIEINNLKLSEFDEKERIRWFCETNMGKNYNVIYANCFKKVLQKFGFSAIVESFSKEDFELIFLKKNN